jgi:hypothetical protein
LFASTDTTVASGALASTVVPPTVMLTWRAGTSPRLSTLLSNIKTSSVPDVVDRLALNLPDESSVIGAT